MKHTRCKSSLNLSVVKFDASKFLILTTKKNKIYLIYFHFISFLLHWFVKLYKKVVHVMFGKNCQNCEEAPSGGEGYGF